MGHILFLAAVRAHRQSPSDDLSECRKVRGDAVKFLCAAQSNSEAAHDLVEDQKGSLVGAQFPEPFQEPFHRDYDAHVPGYRFHDDGGDLTPVALEEFFHRSQIVVLGDECVPGIILRDPGAVGDTQREGS